MQLSASTLNESLKNSGLIPPDKIIEATELEILGDLLERYSSNAPKYLRATELVGAIVAAGYKIDGVLGQGGMAIVFKVTNLLHDPHPRQEALKVLWGKPSHSEKSAQRFQREYEFLRSMSKENRPYLPKFYKAYQTERGDNFFTMELLEGQNTREFVEQHGTMHWREALEVIRNTAAALADCHAQQKVHRDIKPSNIFLADVREQRNAEMLDYSTQNKAQTTPPYKVVLLDFGLTRTPARMNREGMTGESDEPTIGTLAYSSANLLLNPDRAGAADDVYSLGCVLYYLLTGEHAFGEARNFVTATIAHGNTDRPRIFKDVTNEDLQRWEELTEEQKLHLKINSLFQRMTHPRAEERLGSAREVAREIDRLLGTSDFVAEIARDRGFDGEYCTALKWYLEYLRDQQLATSPLPLVRAEAHVTTKIKEVFVELSLRSRAEAAQPQLDITKERSAEWRSDIEREERAHVPTPAERTLSATKVKERDKDDDVQLGELLAKEPGLIFLGPPGGGKTTLLKRIGLAFAEGHGEDIPGWNDATRFDVGSDRGQIVYSEPRRMVPIFLRLRNFGAYLIEHYDDGKARHLLLRYLQEYYSRERQRGERQKQADQTGENQLPADFFARLLDHGDCVVLMDGLDEVPEKWRADIQGEVTNLENETLPMAEGAADLPPTPNAPNTLREAIAREVARFVYLNTRQRNHRRDLFSPNRFVMASRPKGYESVARRFPARRFTLCEVKSLSLASIRTLVGNVLRVVEPIDRIRERDQQELFERIKDSRELTLLAGTPLFCTSLVLMYKYRGAELPKRRVDVFDEIVNLMLGHWKAEERKQIDQDDLSPEMDVKDQVSYRKKRLSYIAYRMQKSRKRTEIEKPVLIEYLAKYLRREERIALKQTEKCAQKFLSYAHERSGLLVEMEPEVFAFLHEGFREYLVASELVNLERIKKEILAHIDDPNWEEVLLLAGAHPQLSGGARASILRACIDESERRLEQGDVEKSSRPLFMAGKMAFDMGETLSPKYIERVSQRLHAAVRDQRRELNYRVDLALALDDLGWLTDEMDGFLPFSIDGREFALGKTPVTNAQYRRFVESQGFWDDSFWRVPETMECDGGKISGYMQGAVQRAADRWLKSNPRDAKKVESRLPKFWNDSKYGNRHLGLPVVGVSWFEANAYCRWLSMNWRKFENPKKPRVVRLPTENEWCRLSKQMEPPSDNKEYRRANIGKILDRTTPCGMFAISGERDELTDVWGNVWEWQASFSDYSYRAISLCGGSYKTELTGSRFPVGRQAPDKQSDDVGFRILIEY